MPVSGNNMFMLEVIVYRVTLTDQIQIVNTCPVCVCFKFPGLVDLVICEGGFCADVGVGGGEIVMSSGKSCLFSVSTADLCRTARDFSAKIGVNRRVVGEQQMRYVAQTELNFYRTFTDVILNPDQEQRSRKMKKVLPLYESGRPNPVGSIEVSVRLTSQGDMVVTHFNRAPDGKNYQYKPINEYNPIQASEKNNSETKAFNPCKIICKHKASCRRKRPKVDQVVVNNGYCVEEMKRTNCVLTMMEKLKDLYKEMSSPANSGDADRDGGRHAGKPCLFDMKCPAARCPFRTDQPPNAFIDHLVNGTRPANDGSPPSYYRTDSREIVDDADLFVLNVGRVDPCRVIPPLVYQDGCSQCYETDFPAVQLPPSVEKKPKKSKKGKSSKKPKAKAKA